ncbi:SAF domain-containing protein [Saccharopolyspora sp. SCSIO 74807]|uniref:SAF domain-containing protein n=1 Tax=Saccharopolyspora sp. SCSIO 74807 TaxID=3118084 RepID=UPI0030CC36DF
MWGTALVLVLGAAGGNAALIAQVADREPMLVLARDVPWGERISGADVRQADLPAPVGDFAVPDTERGQVVGLVAGHNLKAGSLLAHSDLIRQAVPGPGQQVVGLRLEPGRFPARGLAPNDPVVVRPAPENSSTAADSGAQISPQGTEFTARVVRSSPPDADGAITVDLLVAEDTASAAAQAAVTGAQVSLLGPPH